MYVISIPTQGSLTKAGVKNHGRHSTTKAEPHFFFRTRASLALVSYTIMRDYNITVAELLAKIVSLSGESYRPL